MSDKWRQMVLMPANPTSFYVFDSIRWPHGSHSDCLIYRVYTCYPGFTGLFLVLLSLFEKKRLDSLIPHLQQPALMPGAFQNIYPSI